MRVLLRFVLYGTALLVLALVACEGYLRAFSFDPRQYYIRAPGTRLVITPNLAEVPGASARSEIDHNRLGLRGPDIHRNAANRLLVIGGSTPEQALIGVERTWAARLGAHLETRLGRRVWVGNAGKAGTNSRHHLLVVERIVPQLPRLDAIVVLAGLNDMLFDAGLHHPPGLDADWDLKQTFGYMPSDSPGLLGRFATTHAASNLWRNIRILWSVSPESLRTINGPPIGDYRRRRSRVGTGDWIDEPPNLDAALDRYEATLTRIVELARKAEARPILVTQPCIWTRDLPRDAEALLYFGGVGSPDVWFKDPRNKWFTPEALRTTLAAYNRRMLAVCRRTRSTCIDLAAMLPSSPANYYDDCHLSEKGSDEVARQVAPGIAEELK